MKVSAIEDIHGILIKDLGINRNIRNKRTARIVSNACLIHYQHCPISFRTVNPIEYKKAMLLFYEQNNISAFRKLFIVQFEFAVNTYF
jgi:hypothetical protein